jgi:hypothetical protein
MVYYVAYRSPYSDTVYCEFLDDRREEPFHDVPYANPEYVKLTAPEAEHKTAMGHGYPVDPTNVPKKVLWPGGDKDMPDVMMCRNHKLVSERFRTLVEQFEPHVHQFIPVDICKSRDEVPVEQYYWINVCNRKDSLDREHTTYAWRLNYTGKDGFWSRRGIENAKMVFSLKSIGSTSLWVDPYVVHPDFYVSSKFGEAASIMLGLSLTSHDEI